MAFDFYEIVLNEEDSNIKIGETYLKEINLSEDEANRIIEEAKNYELIRDIKGYEELYWHNNDVVDHSSSEVILNYYSAGIIIKDSHFYGTLVNSKDTSSMGMQVNETKDIGLVCIDGFKDGKVEEHESHGSDEVYWQHNVTYYLKKK